MTDCHSSRSKRGKSRRPLHHSTYDSEALKSQGSRHGQGNLNEHGTGGATGLLSEQDHSNARIMDLQDDIPSRASSVGGSSANNMNLAPPNELEGHGGESQHERAFDMQSTANDHMEQPHSGSIPSSMGGIAQKPEETCKLQDGDHGFEVDSSIQKSTIMMKRLRSKSESKISESEYRAGHDPGQEEQGHGHKRHLQDHWSGQEPNQVRTTNQQAVFTLPPPREDRGCVLCYMTYEAVGNNIVLCDKCSRGFHQLCYSPTIDNRFVEVRDLEWHCFTCSSLGSSAQEYASVTEDMTLTGDQVPKSVKESYLWSMRKADLVQFINRIESSSPALKLYPSRLSSPTDLTDMSRFIQSSRPEQSFTLAQDLSHLPTPAPGIAPDYFTPHFQPTTSATSTLISDNKAAVTPFTFNPSTITPKSTPARTSVAQTGSTEQHKKSASTGKESTESTTGSTGSNYNSVKALDLPPYEEMIFMAIADLREDAGSAPKAILDWVHDHYPVPDTFRASCGQAISKAAKKGRLVKDGALYKLKPGYNYPPKRIPRHTGGPRTRSVSYTAGLPLNLQPLSRPMAKPGINSSGFERMDMIMDTNVYNMLPNAQFQVQQTMVTSFNPDSMVVSSGQANNAHPFKIGKPLVGDTEMVEALAVQPSLIGNTMSNDPQLVGLGLSPVNSLKQDTRSNFVLGQEMGVNAMMTSAMTSNLQAFPNGLQGFRPPHLVSSVHGTPMQLMQQQQQQQQQQLQQQSQRLHLSTQPQQPLGTVPWNLTGSTPLSLESLSTISPISTPNNNQSPRFLQGFPRQNRAMSITTPIQYTPSMFGDLSLPTPISLTPSTTTSQLAQDTFRQPPRPLPLHMTPGLTNNFAMTPMPGTPGQVQGQGQGHNPRPPQFVPLQHLPFYTNSISAPSSPLEANMHRANTPSKLVYGSVNGQQAMDVMPQTQAQQQVQQQPQEASSSPSLSTASSSSHTSLPLTLMIKDGRVLSRD